MDNTIVTTILKKPTNNDPYINWNTFAPVLHSTSVIKVPLFKVLKRGTLITLVECAYIVCSTNEFLQKKLKYLVIVFHETNNHPHYVIKS